MLKSSLILLTSLALVTSECRAQVVDAALSAAAPKIFCAKPDINFGSIGENEVLAHVWEVGNAGDAELEIKNVQVKLGHAEVDRTKLQPGETCRVSFVKELPARWDHRQFGPSGWSYKAVVTLTTNDPLNPYFNLALFGGILPPLSHVIKEVDFGVIPKGATTEPRTFEVLSSEGDRITEVSSDDVRVVPSFELLRAEGKKLGWRIKVIIPPTSVVSDLRATIQLKTTAASQKTLEIPVRASIAPEVRIESRTCSFRNAGRRDPPAVRSIEIEKVGRPDLKLEIVQASPEGSFTARVEEVEPGRRYRLLIAVAEGAVGYRRGIITIRTNCPGETELPVYCYAIDRP